MGEKFLGSIGGGEAGEKGAEEEAASRGICEETLDGLPSYYDSEVSWVKELDIALICARTYIL